MIAVVVLMRFVPAILYAVLIFWLSAQPRLPQAPFLFAGSDKLLHALEYAGLMVLCLFAARWPQGRRAWAWVLPVAVYAATDELHQWFVPGRTADVLDWVADSAGAVLLVATWLRLRGRGLWLRRVGAVS